MAQDDAADIRQQYNSLGQLAAGVGHHVINAYAAIVSNAEILKLTAQMPNAVDPAGVAATIIKTAVEASGVARRLIDYSRSATQTGPDLIAPDQLIRRVVEEGRAAEIGPIDWVAEAKTVPAIRGDEAQLRYMLGLLTANAREAIGRVGGTITLVTGLDDRGWVVIELRDTGQGLDAHVQERAVEPFFSTKPGHLGVGLSVANGIWRRHRGTLSIRGCPGEGARVRLCVEPAEGAIRTSPSASSGGAAG